MDSSAIINVPHTFEYAVEINYELSAPNPIRLDRRVGICVLAFKGVGNSVIVILM